MGSDFGSDEPLAHVQPAHWPKDMADAAEMMESRLSVLKVNPGAENEFAELSDLISWAAEIAADTDLSEADWIAIYETSERLRRDLLSRRSFTPLMDEVEQLVILLRDAHRQLDMTRFSDNRGYPVLDPRPTDPGEQ